MADLTELTDADHAAAVWNELISPGATVIRIDDLGKPHRTETTSRAWVLPAGTAVVKCEDAGPYKLSRVWPLSTFCQMVERYSPPEYEAIDLT